MYAEYKTIHTKCISLLNVLNHARLPEFFCYTKILQMAKNIFTSIHFDSLKILTCMANSADGIMLIAKKSSAYIVALLRGFSYSIILWIMYLQYSDKEGQNSTVHLKEIYYTFIILNENICIKLFITIKENFDT